MNSINNTNGCNSDKSNEELILRPKNLSAIDQNLKQNKWTARMRWNILSKALCKNQSTDDLTESDLVSKRLFKSYGLIKLIEVEDNENSCNYSNDNQNIDNDCRGKWFECMFSEEIKPELRIQIRLLTEKIPIHELLTAFDNTGNVCLWPSEEVLAYYCLRNRELFSNKTVLELGGGMTCLVGLTTAVFSSAKQVILTDGNQRCLENIEAIVERNEKLFENTVVISKQLKWGNNSDISDYLNKIDVIFCSDCLYFDNSRHLLVETMFKLLKSSGIAIILAPTRGHSLKDFAEIAKEMFKVKQISNYDEKVWRIHNEYLNCLKPPHYVTDLHFPLMITLSKTNPSH